MSDDLFDAIESVLAQNVTRVEDGWVINTRHEGAEPPDDGNEWVRCYTEQGNTFWVLAQLNERPPTEGRFWHDDVVDGPDDLR